MSIRMCFNKHSLLLRIMESSFPFLQLVPGLPHALCLLLHGVRGVCRLEKGSGHKGHLKAELYRSSSVRKPADPVCAGRHGTGV